MPERTSADYPVESQLGALCRVLDFFTGPFNLLARFFDCLVNLLAGVFRWAFRFLAAG